MKKSTQSNQASGSPMPPLTSTDPVAVAQAELDALVDRFVKDGSLTAPERAALAEDMKSAKARLNELKRGQQ